MLCVCLSHHGPCLLLDWVECANRTTAYELWGMQFNEFERKWNSALNVRHQKARPENIGKCQCDR